VFGMRARAGGFAFAVAGVFLFFGSRVHAPRIEVDEA